MNKLPLEFLEQVCYNSSDNIQMNFLIGGLILCITKPTGVCSQNIEFDIEDNKVKNVHFIGGCNGNLQGIARLVEGMDVQEVIDRVEGIRCGFKATSCPDQLAQALKTAIGK